MCGGRQAWRLLGKRNHICRPDQDLARARKPYGGKFATRNSTTGRSRMFPRAGRTHRVSNTDLDRTEQLRTCVTSLPSRSSAARISGEPSKSWPVEGRVSGVAEARWSSCRNSTDLCNDNGVILLPCPLVSSNRLGMAAAPGEDPAASASGLRCGACGKHVMTFVDSGNGVVPTQIRKNPGHIEKFSDGRQALVCGRARCSAHWSLSDDDIALAVRLPATGRRADAP